MAPVFYFIAIFGGDKYKDGAIILSISITINIIAFGLLGLGDNISYTSSISVAIYFDSLTAFILTYFLSTDKLTAKQAILLSFATFCHIMIIYDLSIYSSSFSNLFYLYYDELIITIGLLQMMVAYAALVNGITNSRRALSTMLCRVNAYCHGIIQNISIQKKTKANP